MGIFAVHYTYPQDTSELLAVRPEHRAWLERQPGLLVAGMYQDGHDEVSEGEPTTEEPAKAALIVYSAQSLSEVVATFDNDPYWVAGLILRRVVREWNPTLGPWVAEPQATGR